MAADGGLTPYLHVRADLWAKVTRALFSYDLVDMGEKRVVDGQPMFRHQLRRREFFTMAAEEAGGGTRSERANMKKMQAAPINSAEFSRGASLG